METKARERFPDYAPPMTPIGSIEPGSRLVKWGAIAKSVTSVIGVISLVVMAGVFLASYRRLPEQTETNRARIEQLYTKFDTLTAAVRDMKKSQDQSLCVSIAEKQNTDWRACFVGTGVLTVIGPRVLP